MISHLWFWFLFPQLVGPQGMEKILPEHGSHVSILSIDWVLAYQNKILKDSFLRQIAQPLEITITESSRGARRSGLNI